jgi:cytochrome c biogenesis protein CcmG, thiol:disulfide interchange protein DsbE
LQSTRSSASPPAGGSPRPTRTAIALLVFVSLAVPAGVLALIATHAGRHHPAANATSTTEVSPTDRTKARVGTAAPNFSLRSTSGRTVTLASLRGRPVVIAFFASWCQPCEKELPVLEQFQHDDAGRLTVVGVNYQDLPSDTAAFVQRLHVTFPALLEDPTGPVAERYGVRGIPQTVFVSAHGIVLGRVYGQTSRSDLAPAISDLLAGRDIRPL